MSRLARFAPIVVLFVIGSMLAPAVAPAGASVALAQNDDVCPEPNDEFQKACNLGPASPALGFLSNGNDIDVYRFEVLDFGAQATLQLQTGGLPYRVSIANWAGDVVATSVQEGDVQVARLAVLQPGSYYAFVDSSTGAFVPSQPYTVAVNVAYASAPPMVTTEGEFRANEGEDENDVREGEDFIQEGGSRTIRTRRPGTHDAPVAANWMMAAVGENFTATIDARVIEGNNAGFRILFGGDAQNRYSVLIDTTDSQVRLSYATPEKTNEIVKAFVTKAIVPGNGVNRVTVQSLNGTIRVFINGQRVISVDGQKVPAANIGFGIVSWEGPAAVRFDNLLVTAPAR
ncbi:MAG: hypothetical protein U0893_10650 [Chloroflexota bacterium]